MVSPEAGADFGAGERITLTGEVWDDDGPNALELAWTFEPEVEFQGNPLTADGIVTLYLEDGLPQDDYRVTLTATDVYDAVAADSVNIQVTENDAPRVSIKEPNESEVYTYGDTIIVQVEVNPKDDEMSQISLLWGGIANGAEDAPDKPPETGLVIFYIDGVSKGRQSLSVTARDDGEQEDTDDVSFTVR